VPTPPTRRRVPDESPARTRMGWPQPLPDVTPALCPSGACVRHLRL
jgi:hypothetical protein